jgi:DNA-binding transcriptional LysR family regulator
MPAAMEFRRGHLQYFVTVAEEGQITRAARKLHIAQPALSQAIAHLEENVGVPLLQRHPRGVTLTPAGEEFLVKARAAVSAWDDAVEAARLVGSAGPGTLEFGFVGAPPGLDSPVELEAFGRAHPDIDVRYRELPFPFRPASAWLADVDVAVSHMPPDDPDVWQQLLRREPRAVLLPARHRLAGHAALSVEQLLDERFIGFHPSVDPAWAGFWSLDDHRGGPPREVTVDHAANAYEVLAALAVREAVTTVPLTVSRLIPVSASGLVAVPLVDGAPCAIAFAGREDRRSPQVEALREYARTGGRVPVSEP